MVSSTTYSSTPATWKKDRGLQLRMILTTFSLFAIYIFFLVSITTYFDVGLVGMAGLFVIFSLVQWYFSDTLALRSMRARVVDQTEYPDLHASVTRLAWQANIPVPKIAVAPTKLPNAFATGRSKNHAAVCVTEGLLRLLDEDELEGVIAHELAHIRNQDVTTMTIASFLSTIAFIIVRWGFFFGGMSRNNRGSAPIYAAIAISFAVWIISFLLIKALSRYREFAADRGAAEITQNPAALSSALRKISTGISMLPPEEEFKSQSEMNAFFIIPIRLGFIGKLFSTHPPMEERIERLNELQYNF